MEEGGKESRAGHSDGLPSLTHWAGAPRAPAAPRHPHQGRGEHWWAAAVGVGPLIPHTPPSPPAPLGWAQALSLWAGKAADSEALGQAPASVTVEERGLGQKGWTWEAATLLWKETLGHPVESPSKTI